MRTSEQLSLICILPMALGLALAPGIWGASQTEIQPVSIESVHLRFEISPVDGTYTLLDKKGRETWRSNPYQPRFGEITCRSADRTERATLGPCQVRRSGDSIEAMFHPLENQPSAWVKVTILLLKDRKTLEFSYEADPTLTIEGIRLLDEAFGITDADKGYAVVPVREGLLIPADSGKVFTHRFETYTYEGCHMAMFGVVKSGSAVLFIWDDPYVSLDLQSRQTKDAASDSRQVLTSTLVLRRSARSFRVQICGPGDYVTVARAYREVANAKGWWVPWSQKLKGHPDDARLFGAINFKLWSTLSRSMNEESTQERSVSVNWTFDEAAQVAEHLKNDLKLDRILFTIGGWIHRGYDNQHPDVLPAAPECGGDAGLANCARRVRQLGYLFCLHDNYQDIYRDSPSWNEAYIMKNPDGSLMRGGKWAGGLAFLTCSPKALDLARRPQNLPAVKALTEANAYFIDTTYAAGLMECFDPNHPLTRGDDMRWKQALSDYARKVFGVFGSECGREWAIPHSDFFEGLTGVSGGYYHDAKLIEKVGGTVVPLFEIVYRDCIAMYGKYGYNPEQAAEYVLHHIGLARPLNYHSIPSHLYWKQAGLDASLDLRPGITEVNQVGPRRFQVTYTWKVDRPATSDWRVFVHFTDADGNIRFQNDHEPQPSVSQWQTGEVRQGPFTMTVPEGLAGTFDVRMGLFRSADGQRASLEGLRGRDRSYFIGKLTVTADQIEFKAQSAQGPDSRDLGLFTRADHGWGLDLHPFDRFVKNTAEILSPLNEITSQMPMTQYQFLTPDRRVQRSVFGEGKQVVEVIVNAGERTFTYRSRLGGEVVLPGYGFLVESSGFVAFHASKWNGVSYKDPPLITLRSLDGRPLVKSKKIRLFHGFGDLEVRLGSVIVETDSEMEYTLDR